MPELTAISQRELRFSEYTRILIHLLRTSWKEYLVPALIVSVAGMGIYYYTFASYVAPAYLQILVPGRDVETAMQDMLQPFAALIVASLVFEFFYSLASLYIVRRAGNRCLALDESASDSLSQIARILPVFIVLFIVRTTVVYVGLLLCFLPGLYLGLLLAFLDPGLVLGKRGWSSFRDCLLILRGRMWKLFALLLVAFLLYYALAQILSIPTNIIVMAIMQPTDWNAGPESVFSGIQSIMDNFGWIVALSMIGVGTYPVFLGLAKTIGYVNATRGLREIDPPAGAS